MKKEFLQPTIEIANFNENVLTDSKLGTKPGDMNAQYDSFDWQ